MKPRTYRPQTTNGLWCGRGSTKYNAFAFICKPEKCTTGLQVFEKNENLQAVPRAVCGQKKHGNKKKVQKGFVLKSGSLRAPCGLLFRGRENDSGRLAGCLRAARGLLRKILRAGPRSPKRAKIKARDDFPSWLTSKPWHGAKIKRRNRKYYRRKSNKHKRSLPIRTGNNILGATHAR